MSKKVKRFTKTFLLAAKPIDKSGDLPSPQTLAHGFCFYYAYIFYKVLGGDLYTHMTPDLAGHAFIKYRGKFYDGDNTQGVLDWRDLQPYLKRANESYLSKQSPSQFKKRWWVNKKMTITFNSVSKIVKENL